MPSGAFFVDLLWLFIGAFRRVNPSAPVFYLRGLMGKIAPRACRSPACSRTTSHVSGYCPDCLSKHRAADDHRRGSSAERGYGTRWQKARATYLAAHPLCAEHGKHGMVVRATVVDHIVPHKGNQQLFWDSKNWQSLCKACHDKKTATEDGGFGRFQKKG